MTTEEKALALVRKEGHGYLNYDAALASLCRAIEQHEAFQQEVSNAVGDTLFMVETHCDGEAGALVSNRLLQFIIPAPEPDPLVEVLKALPVGRVSLETYSRNVRASLDALGFEIREKGQ